MATSETGICNMALGRIGAKRLNDLDTDDSLEAIHCRLHYERVRNSLLRSHRWAFAISRAELSEDTETPDFQWDHQYILPIDCLRVLLLYDTESSYAIEGDRLLTNDGEANIVYIRRVTDVNEFDALYVEMLVLHLAARLVMPLSQDRAVWQDIQVELRDVTSHARMVNYDETNTLGRDDQERWLDARAAGGFDTRIDSRLGSG